MFKNRHSASVSMFRRGAAKFAAVTAVLAVGIQSAHADLPAPAKAAFDGVTANFNDMVPYAWGVAGLVTGTMIFIKLFKRMARGSS